MTFDEVREILKKAAWTRKTSLLTLFDELVERHNQPQERKFHSYDSSDSVVAKNMPGKVTQAFTGLTQPSVASGQIVAKLLYLRRKAGLSLYETGMRK